MDAKQLYELSQQCFQKRAGLLSLWQSIAENFYVERADFTLTRGLGDEFAAGLMTSYPLLARRDLGDQISVMLRPTAKPWFNVVTSDSRREDNDARRWLEWAGGTQRRAMYDRSTQFTRATKEGDHDYAAFGQCALSIRLNRNADALLYRCWHLRDVAWMENADGKIGAVFRKWKPTLRVLNELFPGKLHRNVQNKVAKEPYFECDCIHMVVEADMYDGEAAGKPYWSVYYDCANNHVIEVVATFNQEYIIPRWQTVSGSQYAFSPATVAALPDARLIQAMMHTLLEAGEKLVNPPMIATQDAVRSDIAIYAGGTTWVDMEYDERFGAALRPMQTDSKGMPFGIEMLDKTAAMIKEAFYLNKLTLPQRAPEMTAYEIGQRIQEYIRGALPLFEPMEMDYNAQLCEVTFDVLMRAGAFGSMHDMPRSLRGAEIQFRFESPLHDAIEQQKGQKFLEAGALLQQAAAFEPTAPAVIDAVEALRDTLSGIGVPAKWIRNEAAMREIIEAQNDAITPEDIEQATKMVQNMDKGAKSAKNLAEAA